MKHALLRRTKMLMTTTILVACSILFQSRAEDSKTNQAEPPASPAPVIAPEAQPVVVTGSLKGRAPINKAKAARPAKEYSGPSIKVEPADPQLTAVWVGSGFPALDPALAPIKRIEQSGYQFRPSLMVVQAGTPVVFPNKDSMYHSVFSYSESKSFDLGRFRQGEEPDAVFFDKPGLVQLFCEVHEHMRASLIVVDTPWFVCSQPDGSFEISGITPGKYSATIWLSAKKRFEQIIEITAGKTLEVDWTNLVETSAP